eukprot:TRINITY_DN4730_c0_g1_i1.p1 TRINITY_DN4730_c0_g1~~TRINITY_DN4730_c0_g1_i1.p1  ORF type:complete len:108 (+),score=21.34 TRINITY_DN4730_c0_g1_i1:86-409(+)
MRRRRKKERNEKKRKEINNQKKTLLLFELAIKLEENFDLFQLISFLFDHEDYVELQDYFLHKKWKDFQLLKDVPCHILFLRSLLIFYSMLDSYLISSPLSSFPPFLL